MKASAPKLLLFQPAREAGLVFCSRSWGWERVQLAVAVQAGLEQEVRRWEGVYKVSLALHRIDFEYWVVCKWNKKQKKTRKKTSSDRCWWVGQWADASSWVVRLIRVEEQVLRYSCKWDSGVEARLFTSFVHRRQLQASTGGTPTQLKIKLKLKNERFIRTAFTHSFDWPLSLSSPEHSSSRKPQETGFNNTRLQGYYVPKKLATLNND